MQISWRSNRQAVLKIIMVAVGRRGVVTQRRERLRKRERGMGSSCFMYLSDEGKSWLRV
jgi:hypothetical protein